MPFEGNHADDIGLNTADGPVCKYDSENGQIKTAEDIFEGGVMFFSQYADNDRALAERLTRRNMKSLPYWQAHPFALLDGEQATPHEFSACMAKVMAVD